LDSRKAAGFPIRCASPLYDELCLEPQGTGADGRLGDICEIDPKACPPGPAPVVVMEVLATFKGPRRSSPACQCDPLAKPVYAQHGDAGCDCGEDRGGYCYCEAPSNGDRTLDGEFLVSTKRRGDYLVSQACYTAAKAEAEPLLRELGYVAPRARQGGCAGCAVGTGSVDLRAALAGPILAALVGLRRRSRPLPPGHRRSTKVT
jgi:hypothetical protein